MNQKIPVTGSETAKSEPFPLFQIGKDQTDAMLDVQKEVLAAYEEASRSWAARVKSEVEFWSELASKLSASRSVPDGLAAYSQSMTQRLQMAADDGRRLLAEGQKIVGAVTRSLSNGRPKGST